MLKLTHYRFALDSIVDAMRWIRAVAAAFGLGLACLLAVTVAVTLTAGTFLERYDVVVAVIAIAGVVWLFSWLTSRD